VKSGEKVGRKFEPESNKNSGGFKNNLESMCDIFQIHEVM
jgi:hypothetical protein